MKPKDLEIKTEPLGVLTRHGPWQSRKPCGSTLTIAKRLKRPFVLGDTGQVFRPMANVMFDVLVASLQSLPPGFSLPSPPCGRSRTGTLQSTADPVDSETWPLEKENQRTQYYLSRIALMAGSFSERPGFNPPLKTPRPGARREGSHLPRPVPSG